MKAACATATMASYFSPYFEGMTILNSVENVTPDIDLLILTGGEDISPSRYNERYYGASGCNPERDEVEFAILERYLRIAHSPRILGVCRGHQLLNIQFGGSLIQDMEKGHSYTHNVEWSEGHPFSWLETVNSMHHQAIRSLGGNYRMSILATEPSTRIIEAILWEDFALGVQFHPEFFNEAIGNRFFSIIKRWVAGDVSLFGGTHEEDENEEEENEEENNNQESNEDEILEELRDLTNWDIT
jgi:gamma-glutamyl-gamma-aminobutyrate hydrolase PuuD